MEEIQNSVGSLAMLLSDQEPVSLVDRVYLEIISRIVRGELSPGTELKSTKLAEELDVSRTPVVQALSRLIADGIVTQERNLRAMVRPGSENWLVEIHDIRLLLEPVAARLAAEKIPDDVLAELEELASKSRPDGTSDWFQDSRRFDYALHLAVAEHCGNLPMQEIIRKCFSYKYLSYTIGEDSQEVLKCSYDEHVNILDALKSHDGELAFTSMQFHLQSAFRHRPSQRVV